MPNINTIINTSDVQTTENQHLAFEVLRDAIVGEFLDNAPKGVTAEVVELASGWIVKADISKAIAPLVARHEALTALGAGYYQNSTHGVQREVVRGHGNLVNVAHCVVEQTRVCSGGDRTDVSVTVFAIAVGSDDRNDCRTSTAQRAYRDQSIKVASIKAAARKSGLALFEGLERATAEVARLEADAVNIIANRAEQAEVQTFVREQCRALPNVEAKTRRDSSYTEVSFPYLSHAEALAVLKAVASLNLPDAR